MKVENNKVVTITYDLFIENESQPKILIEKADKSQPAVFLFGASGFPEKFEDELDGLNSGDSFEFSLTKEEAYGDFEDEALIRLDKSVFKENDQFDEDKFKVGSYIPMSDQDGNTIPGKIMEVTDTDLQMDFNHPLAGFNLSFVGEVIDVRDASQEEVAHGHVHGEGGHHH
ncbi:MAG TPA: FKBP-type peptidyl-prolyl cis-trans isomerase [Cytophagaceae bacterium]|jgi:FKBP-type peptidyl-prolyl cis-trans isomerase SlyD